MAHTTLRKKFNFGLGAVVTVSLIFVLGVHILGKVSRFQTLERTHMELVMRLDTALLIAQSGGRNADNVQRADVLKWIDDALSIVNPKDQGMSEAEINLYKLLGMAELFSISKKDGEDLTRLRGSIAKESGNILSASLASRLRDDMEEIIENSNRYAVLVVKIAETIQVLVTFSILFGIFMLGMTFWLLRRNTLKPLNNALKVANRIADGDLTGDIDCTQGDEIGYLMRALSHMNNNLLRLITPIRDTADTLTRTAQEIFEGTNRLSERTEQQASSLEETASSMEELTSTVKQNSENAQHANQQTMAASDIASKGGRDVEQVVQNMSSIKDSSRKIVDIIKVIDDIAFQTNLLALNATVEAARAGEQGRGFAVVASQVRELAQRSAVAATEIKALIGDSVEKVDSGSKLVANAVKTMLEIVTSVKNVTDIMAEISAASSEQTSGIEQINLAIIQMDQFTQQNASLVEEATASAESLQEQAQNLLATISAFKLNNFDSAPRMYKAEVKSLRTPSTPAPTKAPAAPSKFPRAVGGNDKNSWQEF